jgi:dipeptidase E
MKILLTSAGITNPSLAAALKKLVGGDIRIAFIPTAANVEDGEKDWLIRNYVECKTLGSVDIVDISAIPKENWLGRLQKANVIVIGGGSTTHLMNCIVRSGFKDELRSLLENKVYVGISAGSMVLSSDLEASSEYLYGDETGNAPAGLGYVPFHIRPHLNSPHFPLVRDESLRKLVGKLQGDIYALDDNSAIVYKDGKIEVVSEGTWKKYS